MAIVSKVSIANMALSNVGTRSTIESLTEQSNEARACNLYYDHAREVTLEAFDWNFARRRAALATHDNDPPSGVWAYRYIYPATCLKARHLENPTVVNQSIIRGVPQSLVMPDAVPFTVELADNDTLSILTDLDEATLVFTANITDPGLFPRFFVSALSYALAHFIAMPITGKMSIKQEMAIDHMQTLKAASAHDANERVERPPRDADHIRARW